MCVLSRALRSERRIKEAPFLTPSSIFGRPRFRQRREFCDSGEAIDGIRISRPACSRSLRLPVFEGGVAVEIELFNLVLFCLLDRRNR